jgi:gamma-glutamylcyclotransferase (GGCT)/AIG2-like uncharacterized protein YtfP
MNKMYMFSYGMNTNVQQMATRCPRSTSLGPAILKGYRFRFANHADVVPDPGSTVAGVLWEITLDCLANLDILEGYPYYYDRKMVEVLCSGKKYQSLVYIMQPGNTSALPSNTYLNLITEGYLQHGIDCKQLTDALVEFDK